MNSGWETGSSSWCRCRWWCDSRWLYPWVFHARPLPGDHVFFPTPQKLRCPASFLVIHPHLIQRTGCILDRVFITASKGPPIFQDHGPFAICPTPGLFDYQGRGKGQRLDPSIPFLRRSLRKWMVFLRRVHGYNFVAPSPRLPKPPNHPPRLLLQGHSNGVACVEDPSGYPSTSNGFALHCRYLAQVQFPFGSSHDQTVAIFWVNCSGLTSLK